MNRHYSLKEAALFNLVFYLCRPGIKKYRSFNNKKGLHELKRRAKSDYRQLLSRWPENGDKGNVMRHNAPLAMPFISIYRAGKFSAAEFRNLLHEAVTSALFVKLSSQKHFDLKKYYKKLERGAVWSQEHQSVYPKTFVYHMTAAPTDPDKEELGWTITRCELFELFSQEGILEILECFCELDYLFLERRGNTKLRRYHTLAEGYSECDFLAYKERKKARAESPSSSDV
ncbi:MAG: L-2-amino-thiazoline-4-carboxylic acid hydrolase [Eubacteriales bacterium]|nr:L-2-amino-thiazoline-4-carboxylic acid hydrolase [Eubacteriales bacterium]